MPALALHHVSMVVSNLEKSLPFYRDVFGLSEIARPNFPTDGAWLGCGELQIHLVVHPEGSFRKNPTIDRNDLHFAFHTHDFEGFVGKLEALGFRHDLPPDDPRAFLLYRSGIAGFPQLYLRDPDLNIIEVNGAP